MNNNIQIKVIENGYIVSQYLPAINSGNVNEAFVPGQLIEFYCWSPEEVSDRIAQLL